MKENNKIFRDVIFQYYTSFLKIPSSVNIKEPISPEELKYSNANLKDLQGYLECVAKSIITYKNEVDEKKKKRNKNRLSLISRENSSEKKSAESSINIKTTMRTTVDFKGKKFSTGSPTRATAHQTGYGSVDFGHTQTDIYDVFKSRMLNEKVSLKK